MENKRGRERENDDVHGWEGLGGKDWLGVTKMRSARGLGGERRKCEVPQDWRQELAYLNKQPW